MKEKYKSNEKTAGNVHVHEHGKEQNKWRNFCRSLLQVPYTGVQNMRCKWKIKMD